jgi:hypothetical protein
MSSNFYSVLPFQGKGKKVSVHLVVDQIYVLISLYREQAMK